jgi:hypothetical protein
MDDKKIPPSDRRLVEEIDDTRAVLDKAEVVWPALRRFRLGARVVGLGRPDFDGPPGRQDADIRHATLPRAGRDRSEEDGDTVALVDFLAALSEARRDAKASVESMSRLHGAYQALVARAPHLVEQVLAERDDHCPACQRRATTWKGGLCGPCYASLYAWKNRRENAERNFSDWQAWRRSTLNKKAG